MFGLNEALMSFIRRQVGLRTDAANAGGSLHGKVGDIKSNLIAESNSIKSTLQKPRGTPSKVKFGLSKEYMTILNITGKGELIAIGGSGGSSSGAPRIKLTIDGVVIFEAAGSNESIIFAPTAGTILNNEVMKKDVNGLCTIPFSSSLKVEGKSHNGGGYAYCLYVKE